MSGAMNGMGTVSSGTTDAASTRTGQAPKDFGDLDILGDANASPDGRVLAYVSDASGTPQVWVQPLVDGTGARRELPVPGVVRRCVWRPDGRRILVQVDAAGFEEYGLAEVDPLTGEVEWVVSTPDVRVEIGAPYGTGGDPYSPDGRFLAFSSNARDREVFDVVVRDLRDGGDRTVLVGDDRYFPVRFSPDSTRLLVERLHQVSEQDLFVCDLRDGSVRHVTPHEGPAKYVAAGWSSDGSSIYMCTTQGRDHLGFGELSLDDGELRWLDAPDHDIEGAAVSSDGTRVAWGVGESGYTRLRWLDVGDAGESGASGGTGDAGDGAVREVGCLPKGVYVRTIGLAGYSLHFTRDGRSLIVMVGRPTAASELYLVDLAGDTATRLTVAGERLPTGLVAPEHVTFPSVDEVTVSAMLYRPNGVTEASPSAVVVIVHGGPEIEAIPEFESLVHALIDRGIGVLVPNIRGSSGRGLRYQRLIYRDWGGGDLQDLAAAARFLANLDWVDGGRLGVFGASYGGFAAMGCLTRLPDLWRAGVAECGVSDLLMDALTFPPSWRKRAKDWIGDPEDPRDAARMTGNSPLTHAHRLRAPLLLIHGENDTRVVIEQSVLMHRRLTELGLPVRFIREAGVGHDPSDRAVRDRTEAATLDWFVEHLTRGVQAGD
jgi:dipeptidyl aminopeptidase/acylaminoacyl peptidase